MTKQQSDYVCPLCCEELDISDREFYPCKCGYQVCMWCWHRIRESESGLCPACRTPYGEDPHQFSAIDVEEVLKANKEKEAAAKKERERQRSLHNSGGGSGGIGGIDDYYNSNGEPSPMDVPKDRTSLANMRVIRRNLVYAVGLPPAIASEEILRRPEYFGQYGKISKIVMNRAQVQAAVAGTDPRRASASVYVTFVHKEDALACILALDGFYLESRPIRASYGTSKYCSAFIKNVRCNNPECTYLHEMGAAEDTFTKQEIQAGYVTSGRDVQARQQQLAAEQVRLGVPVPRKRVGGGGPSGTGKVATNPFFPVPEYDEPTKPSAPSVPPPAGVSRATTQPLVFGASTIPAKLGRASSVSIASGSGTGGVGSGRSPTLASQIAPPTSIPAGATMHRKSQSAGANTSAAPAAPTGPPPSAAAAAAGTTAAAVVASGRAPVKSEATGTAHSTLTPLTPLKRATKSAGTRSASVGANSNIADLTDASSLERLTPLRNGTNKKQNGTQAGRAAGTTLSSAPAMPSSATSSNPVATAGVSSIGGAVIGPPTLKPRSANSVLSGISGDPVGPSIEYLGGRPIAGSNAPATVAATSTPAIISANNSTDSVNSLSSLLGGEVFTGQLPSSSRSAIGSNVPSTGPAAGAVGVGNNNNSLNGLWNSLAPNPPQAPVGGNVIGGSRAPGPSSYSMGAPSPLGGSNYSNSSSALASILGINLPTGSGSLAQDSTTLWSSASTTAAPAPSGPSPLSALNSSAVPTQGMFGGRPNNYGSGGSSSIGGIPIGGGMSAPGTIGGGNKTDIALLQSLLPGVHITSGSDPMAFSGVAIGGGGGIGGWNAPAPGRSYSQGIGPGGLNGEVIGGGLGGGVPAAGSAIGPIGQNAGSQGQRRGPGIW